MDIPVNIKEYIVSLRKKGVPDSKITENLTQTNWPEDIISAALKDADMLVQAAPEPSATVQFENIAPEPTQPQIQTQPKTDIQEKQENRQAEINKLKEELNPVKPVVEEKQKEKKGFSFLGIFALLFSPIPFIGLGIGMAAFESIRKNKQSGAIFALLAVLINIGVILLLLWIIFQIFSLNPDNLAGFSKFVNDKFKIM